MIDVKSEITYLLVVDYLTRMAADQVISEKELSEAKRLAALEYGIHNEIGQCIAIRHTI